MIKRNLIILFVALVLVGCGKADIKQESVISNDVENQSQDEDLDEDMGELNDFYIIEDVKTIDDAGDKNIKVEKDYEDYPFMATMSANEYYKLIANEYIDQDGKDTNLFIGWKIGQLLSFVVETEDIEFENALGDITETEIILPFVRNYHIPFNWEINEYDELVIEYKLNDDGTLELTNNGNTICFEISEDKKLTKEYEETRKEAFANGLCVD